MTVPMAPLLLNVIATRALPAWHVFLRGAPSMVFAVGLMVRTVAPAAASATRLANGLIRYPGVTVPLSVYRITARRSVSVAAVV